MWQSNFYDSCLSDSELCRRYVSFPGRCAWVSVFVYSSDSITFLRSLQAVYFPSQMLPLPLLSASLHERLSWRHWGTAGDRIGLSTFEIKFSVLFPSYTHFRSAAPIHHLLTALFCFLEREYPAAFFFKLCISILSICICVILIKLYILCVLCWSLSRYYIQIEM